MYCKYCDKDLDESFFHKCKVYSRGYAYKCKSCQKKSASFYYQKSKEKAYINHKLWVSKNKEKSREYSLKWRHKNLDFARAITKRSYLKNKSRAISNMCRRRASKLEATPVWRNQFFIDEIYDLANLREKLLGGKWHVDHIVPLRSKLVCGLHVEANLAVIPSRENQVKGNRSWPFMP